ncbi:MAG: hypothetical protein HY273_07080 [Gammaproteobacteria bacterium]|nr:hypothetical protein [Gammaproteobacteria bacterium]
MTKSAHKYEHVANLLQMFPRKHTGALLLHFSESVRAFESGEWEQCILKAGKFVEAVIKALSGYASLPLPNARKFKVSNLVAQLEKLDAAKFKDSVRLIIPRNCVFVYDIASNRGSRHDPDEIDPNKMDAIAVVQNISWVLAEMIRLSHDGSLKPDEAADVVDGLMEKRYPEIEDIDGRLYVNRDGLSAADIALLLLERKYPSRFNREELVTTLVRHSIKKSNAQVAVSRIQKYIDDDRQGNLKLRANGRQKAAQIRAQGSM